MGQSWSHYCISCTCNCNLQLDIGCELRKDGVILSRGDNEHSRRLIAKWISCKKAFGDVLVDDEGFVLKKIDSFLFCFKKILKPATSLRRASKSMESMRESPHDKTVCTDVFID